MTRAEVKSKIEEIEKRPGFLNFVGDPLQSRWGKSRLFLFYQYDTEQLHALVVKPNNFEIEWTGKSWSRCTAHGRGTK